MDLQGEILTHMKEGEEGGGEGVESLSSTSSSSSSSLSEFTALNIVMDYVFRHQRDEYRWHFNETSHLWGQRYQQQNDKSMFSAIRAGCIAQGTIQGNGATLDMLEPFPRVAVHASHIFPTTSPMFHHSQTPTGRGFIVASILREGYCYSLPIRYNNYIMSMEEATRCQLYHVKSGIHTRGEWAFEAAPSYWLKSNPKGVAKAHIQSSERNPRNHEWDEEELGTLFV
jgi:hypothetical protein